MNLDRVKTELSVIYVDHNLIQEDYKNLEHLIALPSNPGKVMPVKEVADRDLYQAYIGSSANPGYRDFAIVAAMVNGKRIPTPISFDINPTSRDQLEELVRDGVLQSLIHTGARIHQTGCNGCIGMGQAPASGRNSLRTATIENKGEIKLSHQLFKRQIEIITKGGLINWIKNRSVDHS